MTYSEHAAARFDGALPDDLIPHCAEHVRDADLPVEETPSGLTVALPRALVSLSRDAAGLSVSIDADDAATLHQLREYLLSLFDHISPGASEAMTWTGEIARNTAPPNLHLAAVRSVRRAGRNFLRVELDCPGAGTLAQGAGMHFSLLLPPPGREPVWPKLGDNGRAEWPQGADELHRAVYTFVALESGACRFTFDVFAHEGGRATGWARSAKAGDVVGVMGPGGGAFPPGDHLLMAGDETALPAIRRVLECSPHGRHGEIFVEVESEADVCEMPRPSGMSLTWVFRERGETLWDHLRDRPAPEGDSRFVWIAAEQALVRKAKARFRGDLGVRPDEGYFAYYWVA
ncbi:MAG: siderophore-interacting protein [Paracoccaceae bacterium]